MTLAELERRALVLALEHHGWEIKRAAAPLGISVRQCWYKVHKHGIRHPRGSFRGNGGLKTRREVT